MKTPKTQVRDWKRIKVLSNLVRGTSGEKRKNSAQKLYEAVRVYHEDYRTKFDYHNQPEEDDG